MLSYTRQSIGICASPTKSSISTSSDVCLCRQHMPASTSLAETVPTGRRTGVSIRICVTWYWCGIGRSRKFVCCCGMSICLDLDKHYQISQPKVSTGACCKYELHANCTSFMQIVPALVQFLRASCNLHELSYNLHRLHENCTSSLTICTSFMQILPALLQFVRASCKLYELSYNLYELHALVQFV